MLGIPKRDDLKIGRAIKELYRRRRALYAAGSNGYRNETRAPV